MTSLDSARPEQMDLRTFKITLSTFSNISNFTAGNEKDTVQSEGPFQAVEMVIISLVTGSISLVTVIGNILVLLAIIINKRLQTINNYFLFSLACADLIIGVIVMNLYTVDILYGYWPLGPIVCDLWMVLDYGACHASAFHLLIISFDRYFCVTKPLTYPAKRTTRIACMMMGAAWILAFVMWTTFIVFWQFIVGERTVPEGVCYGQFLSNPIIVFIAAIIFFYVPVTIMGFLYWLICRASKSHMKTGKQETKQDNPSSSKAGNHITMPCDDEYEKIHHTEGSQNGGTDAVGNEDSSVPVHPERNEIAEAPAVYEGNPTAHGPNATMAKQPPTKKALSSREKKVTRTVMAVLVAFVVTWLPYYVTVVVRTFCSTCVSSAIWTFCSWFACFNSTINPACYALCNNSFKKTFKQLLLCQHKDIRLGR